MAREKKNFGIVETSYYIKYSFKIHSKVLFQPNIKRNLPSRTTGWII